MDHYVKEINVIFLAAAAISIRSIQVFGTLAFSVFVGEVVVLGWLRVVF